jgi:hypothetical protein
MQGNQIPPEVHNYPITESKNIIVDKMLDKEFKSPVLKKISDLKEDLDKQMKK